MSISIPKPRKGIEKDVHTVAYAREYVGGLSNVSKMPGRSGSISAFECIEGSKLRAIPGTRCSICYAMSNRYPMPVVQNALARRLKAFDKPLWVPMMAKAINKDPHFRWFDSGDLQSVDMLRKIVHVCNLTPQTKHWLPTGEHEMVREYRKKYGSFPENLIVRVSAIMIGGLPPRNFDQTSTIHPNADEPVMGQECPSYLQEGKCQDCRACWDSEVRNVSYLAH